MTQNRVSKDAVGKILINLVLTAAENLSNISGTEREKWIIGRVNEQVENYDHLIPGLKEYADLPWVDALQAQGTEKLIQFCVRKAYTWAVANKRLPEKGDKAPEAEPTAEDKQVADALGVPADAILTPVQASNQSEDAGGDDADYESIAADYAKEGGWYDFPGKDKDGERVKKQGLANAVAYLKTRDDLVFEETGGDDD